MTMMITTIEEQVMDACSFFGLRAMGAL